MSYKAVVTEIQKIEDHSGADRLQIATILGKHVIVGLDSKEGDKGVYFPSDGQLSHEFCMMNDLYRKNPETGEKMGGYFEANRRVRVTKLRGELSDGFFAPFSSFTYTGATGDELSLGTMFDELHSHPICGKYINEATKRAKMASGHKGRKELEILFPEFFRVGDTTNLNHAHRLDPWGRHVILTEKVHGTSGRTGYIRKAQQQPRWWEFWKRQNLDEYAYISGTRRTILAPGSYHEKDDYRKAAHSLFEDKLHKGEIVYYEIVGFDSNGGAIQPPHDITKVPEIQQTVEYMENPMFYKYGCGSKEHKVLVYRMGIVAADGDWIEYPWYKVQERCRMIGAETVPELEQYICEEDFAGLIKETRSILDAGFAISQLDGYVIMEGVVVRIEDDLYKFKSDWFCELEDIAKDSEKYIDPDEVN